MRIEFDYGNIGDLSGIVVPSTCILNWIFRKKKLDIKRGCCVSYSSPVSCVSDGIRVYIVYLVI